MKVKLMLLSFLLGVLTLNVVAQENGDGASGGNPVYLQLPISGNVECTPPIHFIYESGVYKPDTMHLPERGMPQSITCHLLTLTSSRVGLGVTSPQQRLHVSGSGLISDQLAVGAATTNFYGLGQLRLLLGNLWTFSDLSNAKIMGYNCLFKNGLAPARREDGYASAMMMHTNGNLQLCTAPYGTGTIGGHSSDLIWNYLTMLNNGYVGVGTENPSERFQISDIWTFHNGGTKYIGRNVRYTSNGDVRITNGYASWLRFDENGSIILGTAGDGKKDENFVTKGRIVLDADGNVGIGANPNSTKKLYVAGDTYLNGNVGIGTSTPGIYKLKVTGKINCTEVVVTGDTKGEGDDDEWPDYVFSEEYNLMSLDEVASYIQENKRLPEIPSAAEVAENGVNLLEINMLLLKKVEELTLYILQQQKEIDELKK